jgi:hypothetical protein
MPQHKGARRRAPSLLQQLHKFTVFRDSVRRSLRLIVQQHGERRGRCQCLDETAQKLVSCHRGQQQMEIGKQMHQRDFVAAPLRIRLPPQVMSQRVDLFAGMQAATCCTIVASTIRRAS